MKRGSRFYISYVISILLSVSPRDLGVLVQTVQRGIIFMRAFKSWSPPRKTETTVDISDRGNMIHVIGYTDDGRTGGGTMRPPQNYHQEATTILKAGGNKG